MISFSRARLVGMLIVAIGNSDCSGADLYAITDEPRSALDGGPSENPVTCPFPALHAGDTTETVRVDSTSRSFVLHIPSTYDGTRPVPLLVDFHRMRGSGSSQLSSSPYPRVTDPEGVVTAFPDGLEGPLGTDWNLGPCCVVDVDDVAFVKALVAQVQKTACIDRGRVYATGATTGGGMVHYLACHAADVFAAVAPAGFDLLQENVDDCDPARPITVISFRGTGESMVPYGGGVSSVVPGMSLTLLGAQPTFEKWAQIDGCRGAPSSEDNNGCSSYSGCPDGVEVILCTEQGSRNEARDASLAWSALKRHSLADGY